METYRRMYAKPRDGQSFKRGTAAQGDGDRERVYNDMIGTEDYGHEDAREVVLGL